MKTVLITGASSGIGKATALLFASRGWKVIAGTRNQQAYEGSTSQGNIHTVHLDIGNSDSIQLAASNILKDFGPVDALVNCAGYGMFGVFESIKISDIIKQYEVNVFGLMEITQLLLPSMRENGGGSIINISSFGGIIGLPFGTPYNSSKFAVEGFSEALSNEVAQFGVKVKIIEPGAIDTNFRNNMQMLGAENTAYQASMGSFFPKYLSMSEKIEKHSAVDVANTIYEACTDATDKLRYVSGNDSQFFIDLKQKNDESTFLNSIRDNFKN